VEDDFWLFLPSLGKPRRVAGSSKKISFVGTQYTMVDLQSFERERYKNKLLASEACAEGPCWVIESVPATNEYREDIGYSKLCAWVVKANFRTVRIDYFDLAGALYKRQTMKDFTAPQGAATKGLATHRVMTNERTGASTTMSLNDVDFNPSFDRNQFSPSGLGR